MKNRIDELAGLMDEFKLSEAEMTAEGFKISFKKRSSAPTSVMMLTNGLDSNSSSEIDEAVEPIAVADNRPTGTAITSPMTGIYYGAPSPGSAPFVNVGDDVTAGQIIGLIEAMKVFNEIPSPTSGKVNMVVAESGQLVNLGDPLLYVA